MASMLALGATATSAQDAAAIESAALCTEGIPPALVPQMRLELVARGHAVVLDCASEGWVVGIEAPSLAEVWVWARRGDGRKRRSRVPRSLDDVDGRALGIAAATLLGEEDPEPPADRGRTDPVAPPARRSDESPVTETPPEAAPPSPEVPLAQTQVVSSRALGPDMVVFLAAAGAFGRLEERHWGLGGLFGIGRHLRATARIDAGLFVLGAPARALGGAWVGLTRVWRRAPRLWFEVGGAFRYAQDVRVDGAGARIGVGPEAHIAVQRGVPSAGRFLWRLAVAPLVFLRSAPRLGAEVVMAAGWVLTP